MIRYRQMVQWALAAATLAAAGGCGLVRKGASGLMAPMATQLADSLMEQRDAELVRDGAPAYLLLLDAMAADNPGNEAILLAASEAQLAYATAFIDKADKQRAREMYRKARNYGQQALALRNRRFGEAREAPLDDFTESLKRFRPRDAEALLTTATAWAMWIIAHSDSPAAMGQMSRVLAMMERVRELDPEVRQGGVDLFYGIYYTVMPLGGGRDLERAREHFERSIAIAGPDALMPRVTFAEFYARYAFDRDLFEQTLRAVLAADPRDDDDIALMNAVARLRAERLLEQADEYF